MNKEQFIIELRRRLVGLPVEDIDRSVEFYSEMIDDRIEEGLDENEAVASLGNIEDIVGQILSDVPLSRIVKERVKPRRSIGAFEIVLLVLGSPIWLSLLIAVFAVLFSIYVVFWSIIITFWAVTASLAAVSLAGLITCIVYLIKANVVGAAMLLGCSALIGGITIFAVILMNLLTKCFLKLHKAAFLGLKTCFIGKGETR